MDFLDILKKAKQQADLNQSQNLQAIKDAPKLVLDRMNMENHPELQGPRLPESTPQEDRVQDMSMNSAMGTISPSKVEGAKALANAAYDAAEMGSKAGAKELPFLQQNLSRSMDQAQLYKDQMKQARMDRLKKALGR